MWDRARAVPVFQGPGESFEADTCRPLVDAIAKRKLRHVALAHGHYPGVPLPADVLPGVKSVGYWDAAEDQDWGLPFHRNEGLEITLLQCGRLEFGVNNREYVLHPGDLTITRPWQPHRVGNPFVMAGRLHFLIVDVGVRSPHQVWEWPPWIMLDPADLQELTTALRENEQPVWKVPSDVVRCLQAMAHALEDHRNSTTISRLTIRINELFMLLLEMFRRRDIPLDESLSSSRRTVELFLSDLSGHHELLALDWAVEDMARSCRLGITQFFHHVRTLTNVTPMHYLNNCRLDSAASLLRSEPAQSITDISLTCGFSSSQYFATAFGRRFGRSPRSYRRAFAALAHSENRSRF